MKSKRKKEAVPQPHRNDLVRLSNLVMMQTSFDTIPSISKIVKGGIPREE